MPSSCQGHYRIGEGNKLADEAAEISAWQCLRECIDATPAANPREQPDLSDYKPLYASAQKKKKNTGKKIGSKPRKWCNENNWRESSISK